MQKWNARIEDRWMRLETRLLRPGLSKEALRQVLAILDPRKPRRRRRVRAFTYYYDLAGEGPMSKEEIAAKLRIKPGRVTSWLEDVTRRLQNPHVWYGR
jgi:hypothetical protein